MTPYEKKANKPFQTARLSNTSVHPGPSYSLKATGPFISPSLKTSRPENRWSEIVLDSNAMCLFGTPKIQSNLQLDLKENPDTTTKMGETQQRLYIWESGVP